MVSRRGSYFHIFNWPISDKPTKYLDIKTEYTLSDWSIYLTILHMMGWSKMNERLHDITPNWMLLDVGVSPKKKRNNTHLILIRLSNVHLVHLINTAISGV
jgi:hypothetical protein